MKTLLAMLGGAVPTVSSALALAQHGNMTNGGGWGSGLMGGYGGMPTPILLVFVAAGLVEWVVEQRRKRTEGSEVR